MMDNFENVTVHCVPSPEIFMLTMTHSFDLCFLDGKHDYVSALTDYLLCKELQIPYILFDNTELKTVRTLLQQATQPNILVKLVSKGVYAHCT